ncbi:MAG TPA: hypothetical protein VF332_00965 [Vicinamibacterales bacterium]
MAASILVSGQGAPADAGLEAFLRSRLRLTAQQIAAVRQGRPIAVVLPAAVDREIQVGGAIHVRAAADRVAHLLQDVERLESGEGFLETRRLSDPPRLEDFRDLDVPAGDIASLRTCRPGNCDVKLGKGAFDLLARIDWTAHDVAAQVNDLARATSLEYINAYRKGGNAQLAIYRDSERPQFIAAEFTDMVSRAQVWPDLLRPLSTYLLGYPAASAPPDTREFFYWSMAEFGLKPVIRLNHVVVFSTGRASDLQYVVAVKQLYASHYFHTALELRAVVADDGPDAPGSTLFILNMGRSDGLTGLFGGLVKSKARSASREGLERALAAIKEMVESGGHAATSR